MSTVYHYLRNHAEAGGNVQVQRFDQNAFVYQPGDPQTHIRLIEKGVIKIGSYAPEGERVIYDVLQPGEFFGDLNYLSTDNVEFFEFAQTSTSVTVLSIALPFFRNVIVHDPVLSDWFNQQVVRRWWKAETRLLYMTRNDVDARLENLRKEYSKPVLDSQNRLCCVFDVLSHQNLADLTGTTRQTISRKLKENLAYAV